MSDENKDTILGALVIATWINCMLLMVETLQVFRYGRTHNRDRWTWWLVLWCYGLDVVCSAMNCACVYLYTVTHWGDQEYQLDQHWPLTAGLVCSGLVGITVQMFLILRYHSLSKNIYMAGFLAGIALSSTGAAVAIGVLLIRYTAYTERDKLNIPSYVWLGATSVTDWLIAGLLVWELCKRKSMTNISRTEGMIHSLIMGAIRTGAVTSLLATSFLISYSVNPHSNISIGFGFCLGRVYTITLLYNITTTTGGLSKFRRPASPHCPRAPHVRVRPSSPSHADHALETSCQGCHHTWTNLDEFETMNTTRYSDTVGRTVSSATEFEGTRTGEGSMCTVMAEQSEGSICRDDHADGVSASVKGKGLVGM